MGKPTGFLEYERETAKQREPKERIKDFREFKKHLPLAKQQEQGARCMACGVPFCQSGSHAWRHGIRVPFAQLSAGDQRPGL